MKKSLLALSLSALTTVAAVHSASACTTWTADTAQGVTVTRSVDWFTPLGGVAEVTIRGTQLSTGEVKGYANPAQWTAKYQTLNIKEYESFHGATVTAINADKGLSVNGQYQMDSLELLAQHKDSGAPAVALADLSTYIASNFATAGEVKQALENNEFQIAWAAGLAGGQHGVHFSVQDKHDNKLVIQLQADGETVLFYNDDDLRSFTNAPLLQEHRKYVADLDFSDNKTLTEMSAHISSRERNARLLFMSSKVDLKDPKLSYEQVEGKVLGIFDRAVLVPQDLIDPDNGDTYATWVSYVYNFDQASFRFRNHEIYRDVNLSLEDVKNFKAPMCSDLVQETRDRNAEANWQACDAFYSARN